MRYCSFHWDIKFISSRHRVNLSSISFLYENVYNSLNKFCLIFLFFRAFDNVAIGMLRLFVLLSTENFPVSKFTALQYTGLKKKNLNSSLSIGQTALKFCLHWASLSLLFYSCSLQMTCNCLGPCPYRTSKKEELIAWQENLQLDSSIFFTYFMFTP